MSTIAIPVDFIDGEATEVIPRVVPVPRVITADFTPARQPWLHTLSVSTSWLVGFIIGAFIMWCCSYALAVNDHNQGIRVVHKICDYSHGQLDGGLEWACGAAQDETGTKYACTPSGCSVERIKQWQN